MNRGLFVIFLLLSSCVNMNEVAVYQYEVTPTDGIDGFTLPKFSRKVR